MKKLKCMFLDKIVLGASHTNPLWTSIILSPASIGPERERPSFLLYRFKHWTGMIPAPFTHVRIIYFHKPFCQSNKRFVTHSLMPICATRMATGLIPYSRKFNGIDISYFWFYPYSPLRTTVILSWLYSEPGHIVRWLPQPFRYCENNQFHTIWTLIADHYNLFHRHFIYSHSKVFLRATQPRQGIPIRLTEERDCIVTGLRPSLS